MANRKATVARTDEADPGIQVPGIYRTVLRHWCRAEVLNPNNRYPVDCYGALAYEGEEYDAWQAEVQACADEVFNEHLAAGTPIDAWWYWLPPGLPWPLDTLGHDPAPRRVTITADDRVDATKWQQGVIELYSRARHYSGCDHAYFQAAMNWPGEAG
ncbi:MAG: hypothetical protein ACLP75_12460 [Mycobacterium sp.]|uniref:hypothetical protein n=1 Tax=Mycobacterium sp. TaxID=1785 RepID=UPI003F98CBE1